MAVIGYSVPTQPGNGQRRVKIFKWEALGDGDTGLPIFIADYSDRTVHGFGTFSSQTCTLQGSNDPRADPSDTDHASAVWYTLVDAETNADIAMTDNDLKTILPNPLWVRPSMSSGGSPSVTIVISGKKTL